MEGRGQRETERAKGVKEQEREERGREREGKGKGREGRGRGGWGGALGEYLTAGYHCIPRGEKGGLEFKRREGETLLLLNRITEGKLRDTRYRYVWPQCLTPCH